MMLLDSFIRGSLTRTVICLVAKLCGRGSVVECEECLVLVIFGVMMVVVVS